MQATVTNTWNKANGTCLQGFVTTTYDRLVELFGRGLQGGDKTTQEWVVEFSDGAIATIYDWKEYATPTFEYQWHIGGHSAKAVQHVEAALKGQVTVDKR